VLAHAPVEVKLFQSVLFAAHADGAARTVIDHYGVTVVDDIQRRIFVVKPDDSDDRHQHDCWQFECC
jgi:hypothetical protein